MRLYVLEHTLHMDMGFAGPCDIMIHRHITTEYCALRALAKPRHKHGAPMPNGSRSERSTEAAWAY